MTEDCEDCEFYHGDSCPDGCVYEDPNDQLLINREGIMKRLNRKQIISQFEEMRQGMADAKMVAEQNSEFAAKISFKSYHEYADSIIVSLGGESVLKDKPDNQP